MHFSPKAAHIFDNGWVSSNGTYLALSFREALNFFVQCVDLILLLFVFFDLTCVHLLNFAHSLGLLGQLLGQLLILFDLLG